MLSAIQYATRDFGLRRYGLAGEFTFLAARASEAFFRPWVSFLSSALSSKAYTMLSPLFDDKGFPHIHDML